MADEFHTAYERDGPSQHAVSLARFWLVVLGLIWIAVGFVTILFGARFVGWPGFMVAVANQRGLIFVGRQAKFEPGTVRVFAIRHRSAPWPRLTRCSRPATVGP